ncbi:hypothetical protein H0G86_003116 [Trichoderma simmonsii]|uniref:Uncharacterized protein n=1 Tax=Trichoderma simmonsii TaxID=1491479 RepID=A0A8G0L7Y6_9HYPO|nr:hypothetical protein H0G86_003116 [Trichoderma simmonsii]
MKHRQNLNRPSGMTKWPQSQPLGFQNEDDQFAVTVEPAWASRNKHMDRALSEMIRPLVRDIQQKILQATDERRGAQIMISLYRSVCVQVIGFIWITMGSPNLNPLDPDRRLGIPLLSLFDCMVSMAIDVRLW